MAKKALNFLNKYTITLTLLFGAIMLNSSIFFTYNTQQNNDYKNTKYVGSILQKNSNSSWMQNGIPLCNASNGQSNPQMISDEMGGAIITWQDYRNGSESDIYAQRIDSDGNLKWNKSGIVICKEKDNQYTPQLCSDNEGGAIIVWRDTRSISGGEIYVQRINSSGFVQWNPNGISISAGSGTNGWHQIISDENGGAFVVWQKDNKVHLQNINSSGHPQWTQFGVPVIIEGSTENNAQLILDGLGGVIVVWTNGDISAQKINSTGSLKWGSNGVLICNAGSNQIDPQLVSDENGGAIITWWDYRDGTAEGYGPDIYAQRINSNGIIQWLSNGVAIATETDNQMHPQITSDKDEGAIIVWMDRRNEIFNIYAQRVNSTGYPQWTSDGISICIADNDQMYPQIISDENGGAIIVWSDGNIYAQYINTTGNAQWQNNGLAVCNAYGGQANPQLINGGTDGEVLFVWQDSRSGTSKIYGNYINKGILPSSSAPIFINNNWTLAKAAGICTGDGTISDPYVIKNLLINAKGTEYGIYIKDSKAFFRIEDCTIFNTSNTIDVDSCIKFYNVTNGRITKNNLKNTDIGIYSILLIDSNNNTIDNNNATNNNNIGIVLINSNNNSITYNNASNNGQHGIYAKYSDSNLFSFNYLQYNTLDGCLIEWACDSNTVFNNTITNNPGNGIRIKYQASSNNQYNLFVHNYIFDNQGTGVKLESSGNDNIIYNNNIIDNAIQASDDGSNNLWDNGSRGNFWSDYDGDDLDDNGIGDSNYTIPGSAIANDTKPIWDDGDDVAPEISILSPLEDQLFGINAPAFDIIIIEEHLHSTWYRLWNGSILTENKTFDYGTDTQIDQTIWDQVRNGTVTISFYANDTKGHWNYCNRTVRKNIYFPEIVINYPNENEVCNKTTPAFNVIISGMNIHEQWYSFYNGTIWTENDTWVDSLPQNVWDLAGNGTVSLHIWANNTAGNIAFAERDFRKDVIAPSISLNSPLNSLNGITAPTFDISISDGNLANSWYRLWNGSILTENKTFDYGIDTQIDQTIWDQVGNGTVTISFYADDISGNWNFLNITIQKDIIAPNLTILNPENNELRLKTDRQCNFTIQDANLHKMWYSIAGGENHTIDPIQNGTLDQSDWEAIWEATPYDTTFTIDFWANDTMGNVFHVSVLVKPAKTAPSEGDDDDDDANDAETPEGISGYSPLVILLLISFTIGFLVLKKKHFNLIS